jgi:Fe-S cluster biogenesis protein NfuA
MTNTSLINRVIEALEKIRPYLKADGGDVELVEVTSDLVVKVRLKGACEDCPYNVYTMKTGVEQSIRKEVPEIKEVVTV